MARELSCSSMGRDRREDLCIWWSRASRGQLAHFLRHLFEMLLAMMLGMFAGGAVFVAATGNSTQDAIENHAVAFVSVMALAMTAPMVAWMRHRHHSWNVCLEMSVAMVAPAIALCVLRMADVISGGICGAYCGLSLVAMVALMLWARLLQPRAFAGLA